MIFDGLRMTLNKNTLVCNLRVESYSKASNSDALVNNLGRFFTQSFGFWRPWKLRASEFDTQKSTISHITQLKNTKWGSESWRLQLEELVSPDPELLCDDPGPPEHLWVTTFEWHLTITLRALWGKLISTSFHSMPFRAEHYFASKIYLTYLKVLCGLEYKCYLAIKYS